MKNLVYKKAGMGTHVNMFLYIFISFLLLIFSTTGFENNNMYIQDENLNYVQFLQHVLKLLKLQEKKN
jgi:hypothetical protein